MITGRRHPWPVTGRAGVVLEPVRPGPDPVLCEVGVAQVAVDQVEQRGDAFDRDRGVAGGGRTDVVANVPAVGQAVQVRCGLVAETGESQRLSAGRRGSYGAQLRRRPVVHRRVHIVGVRVQVGQVRVVDANLGVGLGIPVSPGFGGDGPAESGCRCAQHDPRVADGLGCVPGHHHLGAGALPELQMQTTHRRRPAPVGLVPDPGTARMRPHQCGAAPDTGAENNRGAAGRQQPAARDSGLLRVAAHSCFIPERCDLLVNPPASGGAARASRPGRWTVDTPPATRGWRRATARSALPRAKSPHPTWRPDIAAG